MPELKHTALVELIESRTGKTVNEFYEQEAARGLSARSIAKGLRETCGIKVSHVTVSLHLRKLGFRERRGWQEIEAAAGAR